MSDDHSNREHDGRFPLNVDQRYITWTEYERFNNGSYADHTPPGHTLPSGNADNSPRPEPISQEELRRRAQAAAELDIQDQAEQTRRNIIYHLQVEEGQSWPDSFAMMIRMEQNYIQRMRNKNASPLEIATANYMLQNPLQDINDWASRQGNAWSVNLKKAVEKKARARKKAKPSSGTIKPQTSTAPLKPQALMAVMIVGLSGLLMLGLVGWWVYRRFF